MITFISQELVGPVWKLIELGDGGTFELAVKRPTLGEQLAVMNDARGEPVEVFLLRSRIVDWRGVNDEAGQPVPYSFDTLGRLSTVYPDLIWDILIAVSEVIKPEATNSKNLPTPPANGGTETTGETTASTALSASITTCVDSAALATNSA